MVENVLVVNNDSEGEENPEGHICIEEDDFFENAMGECGGGGC